MNIRVSGRKNFLPKFAASKTISGKGGLSPSTVNLVETIQRVRRDIATTKYAPNSERSVGLDAELAAGSLSNCQRSLYPSRWTNTDG